MTTRQEVCPTSELEPGDRKLVEVGGISIGVFNVDGEFHALNNVCPHQLADLCAGPITGTTTSDEVGEYDEWVRDGEIIRCPWHGWEFEIESGESLFNPHVRTRSFEATVEESDGTAPESSGGAVSADPDETEASESTADGSADSQAPDRTAQEEEYGTNLAGDEPPVDTYDVEVEQDTVVVYV